MARESNLQALADHTTFRQTPLMTKSKKTATTPATPKTRKADDTKIAKGELVELLAERTTLTKKEAGTVFDAVMDSIVGALRDGKSVGLTGLGTFSVKETIERQGVRPGTSERITIPAGKKVAFKVASTLKGNL